MVLLGHDLDRERVRDRLAPVQAEPRVVQAGPVHAHERAGVAIARVHAVDAAAVRAYGYLERQLEEMRGARLLGVERRTAVELVPTVVVVGRRRQQRLAMRRRLEPLVSPAPAELAGDAPVLGMGDQAQTFPAGA